MEVLTFQIECVNHLACAQVDGQVWTTIGCLSGCREIAVNDIAGIGSARKRHRDTGVQCFGFCEEVHFFLKINLFLSIAFYYKHCYNACMLALLTTKEVPS